METLAELLKTKDATGHVHGSDGKFTSGGGGGAKKPAATSMKPGLKGSKLGDRLVTHDGKGGTIIDSDEKDGKPTISYRKENGDEHWCYEHEVKGHYPAKGSKKMDTVGELMKSGVSSLGELLSEKPNKSLLKRRVTKYLKKYMAPQGTMEDLIAQVREPAMEAVPCEAPPAKSGMPYRENSHWLSIVGTEPDRVLVHCDNENKTWAVPYEIKDNEVVTKDPIECEMTFEPIDESDNDDDEDDEEEEE